MLDRLNHFSGSYILHENVIAFQGTSVLSPGIPLVSVIISGYVISQKSVTMMYENHPVLFIVTFGVVAAKVTNKLVVSYYRIFHFVYVAVGLT